MKRARLRGINDRVFIERLHLDADTRQVVIVCPFHTDSGPSFSIDLDRGIFYCHGGCDEPKGGGAEDFLVKWERIKNGTIITRDDARRRLTRFGQLQSAQEHAREMLREDVDLFRQFATQHSATYLRQSDRLIALVGDELQDWPHDERIWDALASLHAERSFHEYAAIVCAEKDFTPATIALYREAKSHGLWTIHEAEWQRTVNAQRARERRLRREAEQKEDISCPVDRDNPSTPKRIPRQPVLTRTPVR